MLIRNISNAIEDEYYYVDGTVTERPDGSLDVKGDVTILQLIDNQIPAIFNTVTGRFAIECEETTCKSLKGSPRHVGSNYNICYVRPHSLDGIPSSIGQRLIMKYDANLGLLPLLNVHVGQSLTCLSPDPDGLGDWPQPGSIKFGRIIRLIKNYVGLGPSAAIAFASELIANGLESNAKF